ncbi:MAG: DUF429 domain-containing protein [Ilumatobacteraceae bacterium]
MRVVGIDLAASPASTGVVVLEPEGSRWAARRIGGAPDDDALVALAEGAVAIGVDAPLGWPDAFVEAVTAHHRFEPWTGTTDRCPLTHRLTDGVTKEVTGRYPLSVSADLLGVVAMRAALLQRRWADEAWAGVAAPRDGSGMLSETYPAAAFAAWGIECRGYKARRRPEESTTVRASIVRTIEAATGRWLDLGDLPDDMVADDHLLDALVCALVAVAVRTGSTSWPPGDAVDVARREGWIHVPTDPLDRLRPPAG